MTGLLIRSGHKKCGHNNEVVVRCDSTVSSFTFCRVDGLNVYHAHVTNSLLLFNDCLFEMKLVAEIGS